MLKDKIKEAYTTVQEDRDNAAAWLACAKEHMKTVDALCNAQKKMDEMAGKKFDKKTYLAQLDEEAKTAKTDPTDPDGYMNREVVTSDDDIPQTPYNPEN